nr:hypothetical protein [Pontibacter sp. BAB1700]
MPSATAGMESVSRLIQRSWVAIKGASQPIISVMNMATTSPRLQDSRKSTAFRMLL